MDTTPAGTPAPPSLPALVEDAERKIGVALTEWSVTPETDAMPPGEITFQATNTGSQPHTLAIEGERVSERTDPIPPGGAVNLTVELAPGTYTLFCPDDTSGGSHASRGMSTPFVVR